MPCVLRDVQELVVWSGLASSLPDWGASDTTSSNNAAAERERAGPDMPGREAG